MGRYAMSGGIVYALVEFAYQTRKPINPNDVRAVRPKLLSCAAE